MRPSHVVAAALSAALLGACSVSGAGTSMAGHEAVHSGGTGVDTGEPARPAAVATAAASEERTERPVSVTLPSGRVLPVDVVRTLPDGALAIPRDIHRAGWWAGSSRLGDPFGSIVLAAHVDSLTQGLGPVVGLLSARPGDRVTATGTRLSQRFRVRSVRLVERASLHEQSAVFSPRGAPRLVLITCAGPYDAVRGGYRDNLVVTAVPDGRMRHR